MQMTRLQNVFILYERGIFLLKNKIKFDFFEKPPCVRFLVESKKLYNRKKAQRLNRDDFSAVPFALSTPLIRFFTVPQKMKVLKHFMALS
ncbi:MAG: hypothetical protein Q4B32_01145 [Clostridia bacterium]|nr:hypothetical protein [Clostridia bacterium]